MKSKHVQSLLSEGPSRRPRNEEHYLYVLDRFPGVYAREDYFPDTEVFGEQSAQVTPLTIQAQGLSLEPSAKNDSEDKNVVGETSKNVVDPDQMEEPGKDQMETGSPGSSGEQAGNKRKKDRSSDTHNQKAPRKDDSASWAVQVETEKMKESAGSKGKKPKDVHSEINRVTKRAESKKEGGRREPKFWDPDWKSDYDRHMEKLSRESRGQSSSGAIRDQASGSKHGGSSKEVVDKDANSMGDLEETEVDDLDDNQRKLVVLGTMQEIENEEYDSAEDENMPHVRSVVLCSEHRMDLSKNVGRPKQKKKGNFVYCEATKKVN